MALMSSLLGNSMGGREYVLRIVADTRDAIKGVDDVANQTATMKDRMIGVGKAVATGLAVGAVVQFGKASIQAAAEADDAMDAVQSVYGSASQSVINFSKTTAERMGMSAQDYQMMAAQAGQALTNLGIDQADAASRTQTLAQRAADVSAIFGGDASTAMDAFTKAMMGQTRGLKQYGISLDTAEIEARAMAKGYVDASGEVTDAGKAIATQELILEETSKQAGAYAANSKDLGSQQDIMRAKMEDLETSIGNKLLPTLLKLMEFLTPFLDFVAKNAGWLIPLAGIILGIVAAVKLWTLAQAAFNLVMLANPIVLVVAAVVALVAILVVAYQKVDWFRAGVDAAVDGIVAAFQWLWDFIGNVFNWIKDHWPLLLGILTGPFGAAVALIITNWDTIKDFFAKLPDYLSRVMEPVWDAITWPFRHAWESIQYVARQIANIWNWVVDSIRAAFSQVWDIITWPFRHAWDSIDYVLKQLVGAFKWVVDSLRWLWDQVYDILTYPFRRAMDAIKWLWNNTLGRINFTLPSWIPGIGGNSFGFPKLAAGGIVTRPTFAMIGEAGPEAVIPLSRMTQVQPQQPVVINVYALTANAEVGQKVYNALLEYQRVSGRGFAS